MDELLKEIDKALEKFAHNDLCEGSQVRDVLLDLRLLISNQTQPEAATPMLQVEVLEKV